MAWDWLNKIVRKVASEVHKSKIEDFEKRILEIERKQEVILKTMTDNQNKLDKLDDRLYDANLKSAAAVGAINTLIQSGMNSPKMLNQGNNEQTDIK